MEVHQNEQMGESNVIIPPLLGSLVAILLLSPSRDFTEWNTFSFLILEVANIYLFTLK